MLTTGGANGARPGLSFTRRALEDNSRVVEGTCEGVNHHRFYRRLRAALSRLREEEPAYRVAAERSRDLHVRPEAGGPRTTAFTGRLQAHAQTPAVGPAKIEHRPWAPHGALLVILGLLASLSGFLHGAGFAVAAGLVLVGSLAFTRRREVEIPLDRRDVVSVLFEGEAREDVRRTAEGHTAALAADVQLVYAAEVFLTVRADELANLEWPARAELGRRCEAWSSALEADDLDPQPSDGPQVGLLDAFRAVAHLDPSWTRTEVRRLQRNIQGSLPRRQAYTRRLSHLRGTRVREEELERVGDELASLDAQMQALADREPPRANTGGDEAAGGRDGQPAHVEHLARPDPRRPRGLHPPPPRTRARPPAPRRGNGGEGG